MQARKERTIKLHTSFDVDVEQSIVAALDFADQECGLTIHEEIGRGNESVIYSACDVAHTRDVAVKAMFSHGNDRNLQWSRQKAAAMQRLSRCPHPNIVNVYDFYPELEQRRPAILLMELVSRTSLEEALAEMTRGDWHNPKTIDIFIQICTALDWAHQHSVIHGDLKPSNVLLQSGWQSSSEEPFVKVTDFCLISDGTDSSSLDRNPYSDSWYLSPEQKDRRGIDERTDIYALGSFMFEAYSGHRLSEIFVNPRHDWLLPIGNPEFWPEVFFPDGDPGYWPDGDPGFGEVVIRATRCGRAEHYYASASEMLEDLKRLKSISAKSMPQVVKPPPRHHHSQDCSLLDASRQTTPVGVQTHAQTSSDADSTGTASKYIQSFLQRLSIVSAAPRPAQVIATLALVAPLSVLLGISFMLGVSPLLVPEIILTPWSEYDRAAQQAFNQAKSKEDLTAVENLLNKALAKSKLELLFDIDPPPLERGERLQQGENRFSQFRKKLAHMVSALSESNGSGHSQAVTHAPISTFDADRLVAEALELLPEAIDRELFLKETREQLERLGASKPLLNRLIIAEQFAHETGTEHPDTARNAIAIEQATHDATIRDARTCYHLAWLLTKRNQLQDAELFARRGLSAAPPHNLDLRFEQLLAEIKWRDGNHALAQQEYEKVLRKAQAILPRDYDILCQLLLTIGKNLRSEGKKDLARGFIARGMAIAECESVSYESHKLCIELKESIDPPGSIRSPQ